MNSPDSQHTKRLLDALEILHAHHVSRFEQRLFEATRLLFRETGQAFEVFQPAGDGHTLETDIDFHITSSRSEFFQHIGELVKKDHPAYHLFERGIFMPFRLSDLLTHRQFHSTPLYQEVFKVMDKKYQLGVPFLTPTCMGALTINRRDRDFSDQELNIVMAFARHVKVAFESHQIIQAAQHPRPAAPEETSPLKWRRLGLTQRECEILYWLTRGKRDAEIAVILGISQRTVNTHVRAVLGKLKVENRTSAAAVALKVLEP